jgi:hypothetical protein
VQLARQEVLAPRVQRVVPEQPVQLEQLVQPEAPAPLAVQVLLGQQAPQVQRVLQVVLAQLVQQEVPEQQAVRVQLVALVQLAVQA